MALFINIAGDRTGNRRTVKVIVYSTMETIWNYELPCNPTWFPGLTFSAVLFNFGEE